jgi:hypothetical protein
VEINDLRELDLPFYHEEHEEERSQKDPKTEPGVLFEHHLAKFEPSAFLPNPLQNVKEQAP